MAIKAVISIIDSETKRTYVKNYLLEPISTYEFPDPLGHTRYDFSFHFNIVNEDRLPKISISEDEVNI